MEPNMTTPTLGKAGTFVHVQGGEGLADADFDPLDELRGGPDHGFK